MNKTRLLLNALALVFILLTIATFKMLESVRATARASHLKTATCTTGTSVVTSLQQLTVCENERIDLYLPGGVRWLLRAAIITAISAFIAQLVIATRTPSAFKAFRLVLLAQLILFAVLWGMWFNRFNSPTLSQIVRVLFGIYD